MTTLRTPLRVFFILYYVYPGVLFPVLGCFASGLAAAILGSFVAGVLAAIFASLSVAKALGLRSDAAYLRSPFPRPGANPVINLRGPFIGIRGKTADLGDRPEMVDFEFSLIVHNIGKKEAKGVKVEVSTENDRILVAPERFGPFKLGSGEAKAVRVTVRPRESSENASRIRVEVGAGDRSEQRTLVIGSVLPRSSARPKGARISRWRHGCLAAAAWRADIDGFDNLSNEETLSPSLEISRFFKIPPSLFISARLSLDFDQWHSWVCNDPERFDGPMTADRFAAWLDFLGSIRACDDLEYPMVDLGSPAAQIGNHMYYHYWSPYGYDASEETGWQCNISPGRFDHGWMSAPNEAEYGEILDNIKLNDAKIREFFGRAPRTWAAPADRPHEHYPKALEEAGILASSEAVQPRSRLTRDVAPYRPDLGECRPHHPEGSAIVETGAHTRRFDPHTLTQVISLKRAVKRAINRGSQVTFVWHPHLRLYEPFFGPQSSLRHFPEFLRFLVEDVGSVCWLTTHYNIARYWEDVLCPAHRVVRVQVSDGRVTVGNASERLLTAIPVDVDFENGKRCCHLVDLGPRSSVVLS